MAFIFPSIISAFQPSRLQKTRRPDVQSCMSSYALNSRTEFNIAGFADILYSAQARMCSELEAIDGNAIFCTHPWERENGGGGVTRVLQGGAVFEKAGVNVSVVSGVLSEHRASAMRSRGRHCKPGAQYSAAALSFVCHAQSPFIPTLRGDVRVFCTGEQFWGGGGVDLTIFYVDESQIIRFHQYWKSVCDDFDRSFYTQFKKQCDSYFFLPSRGEYRGVGGLFYDDIVLSEEQLVSFQSRMLAEFLSSYTPTINENRARKWTDEEKRWQRIRRGRYLEFNLLEDRGVRFGLVGADSSRTDAIMISAPPSIEWPYGYTPLPNSAEDKTLRLLRGKPRAWADVSEKRR